MPKQYLDQLIRARGRVAGERRVVTILFVDVVGSTSMAEKLDPEEVMEIMSGALAALIEPVYRLEGTLARLMGDALLCFFGAPLAHEDDPVRACTAALDMLEAARRYDERLKKERGLSGFSVRVGINTGLVVVGEVGNDLRVEYTAMGDAVNLAARMESAALPGTILITEATRRLVQNEFKTEAQAPLQVKGKAEPVCTHRLVASLRTRPDRESHRLRSVLVGRQEEMSLLTRTLERLTGGRGRVIAVSGAPGLGKTRLVSEIRGELPAGVQWIEGRCLSYAQGISYWVVREVLQQLLGVDAATPPAAIADRLRSSIRELAAGRGSAHPGGQIALDFDDPEEMYLHLSRILQLPEEPRRGAAPLEPASAEVMQRRLREAFRAYIRRQAQARPLVLVWEDLHWIDPSSPALLEALVPLVGETSLLLLLLFRPREGAIWEFHGRCQVEHPELYLPLDLAPLSRAASTELLSNLLLVPGLPAQSESLILDATEGNAFFLEELLRSLLDADLIAQRHGLTGCGQELQTVQVPNTLHGAVMSRVDRLGPVARRVLQTASVIGRLFPLRVLERMLAPGIGGPELTAALTELEGRDFIEVSKPGPVVADRPVSTLSGIWRRIEVPTERPKPGGGASASQGEMQYAFKHAMLAEVTYSSLLKSDRRDLHRRAGEATEMLYPDRLEATAWSLAYHFERGGVRSKAYHYLVKAGDRALGVYANQEAVDCYRRAVGIALQLDHLPDGVCGLAALYEKLGDVHYLVSDYAAAADAFEHALSHVDRPRQRAALHRKVGQVFEKWGRYDRARASLEAGIETMAQDLDEAEAARIYSGLCLVYYHKGELDSARDLGELALDMMRKLDDRRGLAQALNNLGVVHGKRSEWGQAAQYHEECLRLWLKLDDAYGLASSYNNLGLVARNRQAWSAAVEYFEKSLAQFEKLGNKHGVARAYDNLGQVLIDQNRVEEAMEYVKKAVTILGEISVDASGIVPEMWQSGAW